MSTETMVGVDVSKAHLEVGDDRMARMAGGTSTWLTISLKLVNPSAAACFRAMAEEAGSSPGVLAGMELGAVPLMVALALEAGRVDVSDLAERVIGADKHDGLALEVVTPAAHAE